MKIHTCLLALLLLAGCAPHMSPTLPPWQGEAVSAQFSARVVPQAADLPLQGGLRIDAQGGTLAVILQHGRTLGHCQLTAPGGAQAKAVQDTATTQDKATSAAPLTMQWQCRVAEGMGASSQQLLTRVALAAYRSVYALHSQGGGGRDEHGMGEHGMGEHGMSGGKTQGPQDQDWAGPDQDRTDWRVTMGTAGTLQPFVYEDTLGKVHMTFSEVRP